MKKIFIYILAISFLLFGNIQIVNARLIEPLVKTHPKLALNTSIKDTRTFSAANNRLTLSTISGLQTPEIREMDFSEILDIIVEFREEPLSMQTGKAKGKRLNNSFYESRFAEFRQDLARFQQSKSGRYRLNSTQTLIKHEFSKVFFGVHLKIPRAILRDIGRLKYVRKIHTNGEVRTCLDTSVTIIRADSVWKQFNTGGDSILVGIIDTGIDYNHPALGGGFGAGFKVIGGYDLMNGDNDPMDDNGHGTHVAGIVAADCDSLRGVAPRALLMAFKVLDADGYGEDAHVIAGIERAIDPNDDHDFSDRVDIINISLSGPGDPDDAVSRAVDKAVKLGVVCVVSAGNDGEWGFDTIGSPGTARNAITVGASSKQDEVTYFSSRGPNKKICSVKPEVVAPGLDIRSSILGGEYERYGGTSMAAPHVAGVCALLKSIHPAWTPAQIKSALMTTAVDLDEEAMVQGAGRIDALRAAEIGVFAEPAHLSFGLDDVSASIWQISDTLRITNSLNSDQDFSISIDGLQSGMVLEACPAAFSLGAQQTQNVIFTLKVDNGIVPYPEEGSLAFGGTISLCGTETQLHLPWTFVKSARLRIEFSEPWASFAVYSEKFVVNEFTATWLDNYTAEFNLPKGIYDMINFVWEDTLRLVFKENLEIEGEINLKINFSDAGHILLPAGVDRNGQPIYPKVPSYEEATYNIPIYYLQINSTDEDDETNLVNYSFVNIEPPYFFTTLSSKYKIRISETVFDGTEGHILQHPVIRGIDSDVTLMNNPEDYQSVNVSIQFPCNTAKPEIVCYTRFDDVDGIIFDYYSRPYDVATSKWEGRLYLTPDVLQDVLIAFYLEASIARSRGSGFLSSGWITTRPFRILDNKIGSRNSYAPSFTDYIVPDGGELNFLGTPFYPEGFYANNLVGDYSLVQAVSFCGAFDEKRSSDNPRTTINVYDDRNNLILTGTQGFLTFDEVPAGKYRIERINSNYFFKGAPATSVYKAWCDLRLADPDPPNFSSLKILNSKGVPVNQLEPNDAATLQFSAEAYLNVRGDDGLHMVYEPLFAQATKAEYRAFGDSIWHSFNAQIIAEDSVTYDGTVYSADLLELAQQEPNAYGLKLYIEDLSGNATEWLLEPAFMVGEFGNTTPSGFTLRKPANNSTVSLEKSINFSWNAANDSDGDMLIYDLTIFNTGLDTTIKNLSRRALSFKDFDFLRQSDSFFWTVSVTDGKTKVASADTFIFFIEQVAAVDRQKALPEKFALHQNYPNPFNPATTIAFDLPNDEFVEISIYNIRGQKIRTLVRRQVSAGAESVKWNGKNDFGIPVASGIYFYRIEAGTFRDFRKMILLY